MTVTCMPNGGECVARTTAVGGTTSQTVAAMIASCIPSVQRVAATVAATDVPYC